MFGRALSILAGTAVVGAVLFGGTAMADTETTPHPAAVQRGPCPGIGALVAPLGDVSSRLLVDGVATFTEPVGPAGAIPVQSSVTTIPTAYADLVTADHHIVVLASADEPTTPILCGDIGGMQMGPTDLAIGLGALGESGFTGIAMLHDDGDGSTRVSVYIVAPQVIGTTEAVPAPTAH